jgi:hypothetical protein
MQPFAISEKIVCVGFIEGVPESNGFGILLAHRKKEVPESLRTVVAFFFLLFRDGLSALNR